MAFQTEAASNPPIPLRTTMKNEPYRTYQKMEGRRGERGKEGMNQGEQVRKLPRKELLLMLPLSQFSYSCYRSLMEFCWGKKVRERVDGDRKRGGKKKARRLHAGYSGYSVRSVFSVLFACTGNTEQEPRRGGEGVNCSFPPPWLRQVTRL